MGELPVNVPYAQQAVRQFDFGNAEFEDEENDQDDDAQTVTDTTASTADESELTLTGPPKPTKAEIRAMKKATKAAKSQSKAAKNQKRHLINVRTEDVDFVAKILHGDAANANGATHPLASDKTIEEVIARNMGFLSSIDDHKKVLLASISQRRRSDRDRRKSSSTATSGGPKKRRFSERVNEDDPEDDEMQDLLVAVLVKLGVDAEHTRSCGPAVVVPPVTGGSAKKHGAGVNKDIACKPHQIASIVASLKALVRDDLERFENEQRETCIRAGGFWRYVGRPVFERMTRIARELDWRTGMKLKQVNGNSERGD